MRIGVDNPRFFRTHVLLDGKPFEYERHSYEADDEAGYIRHYAADDTGLIALVSGTPGNYTAEPICLISRGKVTITFEEDV